LTRKKEKTDEKKDLKEKEEKKEKPKEKEHVEKKTKENKSKEHKENKGKHRHTKAKGGTKSENKKREKSQKESEGHGEKGGKHIEEIHKEVNEELRKERKFIVVASLVLVLLLAGLVVFFATQKPNTIKNGSVLNPKSQNKSATLQGGKQTEQPAQTLEQNNGKMKIELFCDFQCPFCAMEFPQLKAVVENNKDKVELVFRNMPLSNIHPYAEEVAKYAECVKEEGKEKYWDFVSLVYENSYQGDSWARKKDYLQYIENYVQRVGANLDAVKKCKNDIRIAQRISNDYKEGINRNVEGTPTIFMKGHKYSGVISKEELDYIIRRRLEGKEDPKFKLTLYVTKKCPKCKFDEMALLLKQQLFPTMEIEKKYVEDNPKILQDANANFLPIYVVDRAIEETDRYKVISSLLVPYEGRYLISPQVVQPVYFLESPSVEDAAHDGNGELVIIEYSDYDCPFCIKAEPVIEKIRQEFAGKITFAYKHLPLPQLHPFALNLAVAAECVRKQSEEEFWKLHPKLFGIRDENSMKPLIEGLNIDHNAFWKCYQNRDVLPIIEKHSREAMSLGIRGTPGFFVGHTVIPGYLPYEQFKRMVEEQLNVS